MKKNILLLLSAVLIMACNQQNTRSKKHISKIIEREQVNSSENRLITFMDSVRGLSRDSLVKKASFYADSVFSDIEEINRKLTKTDFRILETAISQKSITINQAEEIFGKIDLDSCYLGKRLLPVKFYAFDKGNKYDKEFAISFNKENAHGRSNLYFFNSDSLLAKKAVYNHYGLTVNHYKDADGKIIIYYKEDYITGTGIWWSNLYFYKYYNNRLIPILNELSNGNVQNDIWGVRVKWLESIKMKTNPLVLKMIYYNGFNEWMNDNPNLNYLLKDSTIVEYAWDEKSKTLKGAYEKSKITKPQLYTYYVQDNELLFINVYYDLLKRSMRDKRKRKLILNYLSTIKKHEEDIEGR
ncbi:hypothetical protein [Pedobacter rhizosphaerae]|uniref:Lipoprotein n=1 Tax=Pedobacter rhizosphaerae TaxID=390241 RepID=A0A1H9S280_9SPHI|nr:hypothetical protein [Pedobacter rhizosphaerae]SER79044.1 hypothetical protein SAMN04488023_11694 [Pedobacter rhizosphaerae]